MSQKLTHSTKTLTDHQIAQVTLTQKEIIWAGPQKYQYKRRRYGHAETKTHEWWQKVNLRVFE